MTVLTQLSVGAFVTIWVLQLLGATTRLGIAALTSLLVAALALNGATFHLGRPAYAYRALKMWRRSWLSREVLLFTAFSGVAGVYAALLWMDLAGSLIVGGLTSVVRHRRRDRQWMHLSRAVPSCLEHEPDARAIQPDGGGSRATACSGARRERCAWACAGRCHDGRSAVGI